LSGHVIQEILVYIMTFWSHEQLTGRPAIGTGMVLD